MQMQTGEQEVLSNPLANQHQAGNQPTACVKKIQKALKHGKNTRRMLKKHVFAPLLVGSVGVGCVRPALAPTGCPHSIRQV